MRNARLVYPRSWEYSCWECNGRFFEKVKAFERKTYPSLEIEIIRGIIQRLSGRTNRYTLRTFSRRMFYLSNASERRDEDRKEGGTYVRTYAVIYGGNTWRHFVRFCISGVVTLAGSSALFCLLPPPRPISNASVITNPQSIPRG